MIHSPLMMPPTGLVKQREIIQGHLGNVKGQGHQEVTAKMVKQDGRGHEKMKTLALKEREYFVPQQRILVALQKRSQWTKDWFHLVNTLVTCCPQNHLQ